MDRLEPSRERDELLLDLLDDRLLDLPELLRERDPAEEPLRERLEDRLFDLLDPPRDLGRAGTLAPFFRASERPIAIACLRLVTFLPLPLLNVPRFRLRIADETVLWDFLPYLAMELLC